MAVSLAFKQSLPDCGHQEFDTPSAASIAEVFLIVIRPSVSQNPLMPTDPKPQPLTPEDDFENEFLNDRQPEACSMDEGCTSCQ